MPVAVLVVHRHAPHQELRQRLRIERLGQRDVEQRFRLVEQEAPVAIGRGDQRVARGAGQRQAQPGDVLGTAQEFAERGRVQPVQDQHLRAAEQRGVEREAGILGSRADQRDRAFLHERQETVLLSAVEAVDFVHEQQRAPAGERHRLGLGKGFLQVGHARKDRADRHEAHVDGIGQQARGAGLAGARRTPQDHRGELARRHHPPDRAFRPGQVLLPDHVGQRARAQAIGQRPVVARLRWWRFGRGRGEQVGHLRS